MTIRSPSEPARLRCRDCCIDRDAEEFPRRGRNDRKRRGTCRSCIRNAARRRREARREELQAYDRRRHQEPARKQAHREHVAAYRARYPERHSARRAVARALKNGTLVRLPCEVCGSLKTQAHHDDYSKPLEVTWLCFRDHRARHGQVSLSGWESPVGQRATPAEAAG